jgi:hypothetical protein
VALDQVVDQGQVAGDEAGGPVHHRDCEGWADPYCEV